MKQSKPSVEGTVPNALAFMGACPTVSCDDAGAPELSADLSADLSELSRLSCLTGLQDNSPQAHAAKNDKSGTGERQRMGSLPDSGPRAAAEPAFHAQGFVSTAAASAAAVPGLEAQLPENIRIARELHDAVSQKLFAANLLAGALARSQDAEAPVREQALVLERLNRSALAEMRMMLFELQPEAMSRVRLPELLHQAVEALAGRGGVEITTDMDDSAPLGPVQRCEVYRIATALLSNIARHSRASHAHLQWSTPLQGPAVLRVCDDGCGFVADTPESHDSGVARIRKLASRLGADLVINSAPGEGTEVTLTFHRSPYES